MHENHHHGLPIIKNRLAVIIIVNRRSNTCKGPESIRGGPLWRVRGAARVQGAGGRAQMRRGQVFYECIIYALQARGSHRSLLSQEVASSELWLGADCQQCGDDRKGDQAGVRKSDLGAVFRTQQVVLRLG